MDRLSTTVTGRKFTEDGARCEFAIIRDRGR
jgi:hypothetical protein